MECDEAASTDDSRDTATRAASATIGHTFVLAMVGNNIDCRMILLWSISADSISISIESWPATAPAMILDFVSIGNRHFHVENKWREVDPKDTKTFRIQKIGKPLDPKDTKTFSIQKTRKPSGSKNSTLSNVHVQCSPIKPSTRLLRLLDTMLRYDNDGEVCIVTGPIMDNDSSGENKGDEGQPFGIPRTSVSPAIGCPVICHGLVNAAHLNGKLGDVRSISFCKDSDREVRLGVHFEDKSLKPAAVKPGNLRIAFVLPSE